MALERARITCEGLGVRFVTADVSQTFREVVVDRFLREYSVGRTPNPCVACNPAVKFAALGRLADENGCDVMATGHYVGTSLCPDGLTRLVRGSDPMRDQSYFMCRLTEGIVSRCVFPLATKDKPDVRSYAAAHYLPAADASDSEGVCFAPEGDYRELIRERMPEAFEEGTIEDDDGAILGKHEGVCGFTIGQRRGLGLAGGPFFVTRIDAGKRKVIVRKGEPPRSSSFVVDEATFIGESPCDDDDLLVQTHFHAPAQPARLTPIGKGRYEVSLVDSTVLAVGGQTAAFYHGDTVLGGATIA
jgi:tRNA-specific 2-thiouridylase